VDECKPLARGMLKQLLDKGASANATFHRAIFILEANVGFVQIQTHLQQAVAAGAAGAGAGWVRARSGVAAGAEAVAGVATEEAPGAGTLDVSAVGRCKLKPAETRVESAWRQRLKLEFGEALSNFAFKSKLRRYSTVQRSLKDLVFQRWVDGRCEERSDTHKAVGAVDLFVPFLPLDRRG